MNIFQYWPQSGGYVPDPPPLSNEKGPLDISTNFGSLSAELFNNTYSATPSLLGYSVATISTGKGIHFVAGAPRANYTGQIVLYRVNENGNVTIIQAHRGDQVKPIL